LESAISEALENGGVANARFSNQDDLVTGVLSHFWRGNNAREKKKRKGKTEITELKKK
jgi:hypothetical protein